MLDHTDHHVGRFVDFLQEIGQLDNTLIFLMSDNGASMEGGPNGILDTFKSFNGIPEIVEESLSRVDDIGGPDANNNYPMGWAQAGNTPLKRYKRFTHGGGIRDPLIVHWPDKIQDNGATRRQFHHIIDVVPTVLDILGIEAPDELNDVQQKPVEGTSLAYTFESENANVPSQKKVQYFEMTGNRGLWQDGWKAVAFHQPGTSYDDDEWELYNLEDDFSECHNLADKHPEKLRQMIEAWWVEAGKYDVLPLDDRTVQLFTTSKKKLIPSDRTRYEYYPPVSHLTGETSPIIGNRSWTMTVDVERPDGNENGVLMAIGSNTSGLCCYIKDGHLVFDYNIFSDHYTVVSESEVPAGTSTVGVKFERIDRTGQATLTIDGQPSGTVEFPRVMRMISSLGMDIGRDGLAPVTDDYEGSFPFAGTIKRLVVDVPKRIPKQAEQEHLETQARTEMGRQ